MNWNILETDANLALMSEVLGISQITATVLANRGIRSKKAALAYLQAGRKIENTLPESMKDAKKAFDRISQAIEAKERIMIYGDYDADGVMSTVILYKALKHCGAKVFFYIPKREEEGYGLNIEAVRNIRSNDHDLLITCDNGIASLAEVAESKALGMDVIIIDHHEPGFVNEAELIPEAIAIIDPKQSQCPYPFKELCAAGLCFMLMEAFFRQSNRNFSVLHDELLALAAIATVCDIVELKGDNRSLVKQGLDILNANKDINSGLGKLITLRGYRDKPINSFTLGFVIGPCINATGRLESAELSVHLLLSENAEQQTKLAQNLSSLNEERKTLTTQCSERLQKAAAKIEDHILVLVDDECHESIAGIVAGRIKDSLHRPVIVLTRASEAGILKGSARSIPAYNMFEALNANRDLFTRFGGHAMAAGLSLAEENAEELRNRLNKNSSLSKSDLHPRTDIDRELSPDEITLALANELSLLAPFGKGNREALFLTKNLQVTTLRNIPEKNTLIFTFNNHLKGLAFKQNNQIPPNQPTITLDAIYTIEPNTFNNRTNVQILIREFKIKR